MRESFFRRAAIGAVVLEIVVASQAIFVVPGFATQPSVSTASPTVEATATALPSSIPTIRPEASRPAMEPYPAFGPPLANPIIDASPPPGVRSKVSLEQAIAIGAAMSPLLEQARSDTRLQKINVRLAETALFPDIEGHASHQRVLRSIDGILGIGSCFGLAEPGPTNCSLESLDASVDQLVYDGGRVIAQIHVAKATQSAAADQYRRQLQTVSYTIATQYFNVLAALRTITTDEAVVIQDQAAENLVRAQQRAGTVTQTDVAIAEVPTAQARLSVIRAQGMELEARAAFSGSMGLPANTDIQPVENETMMASGSSLLNVPDYNTALSAAYAHRPDLSAALHIADSLQYGVQSARAGLYPSLRADAEAQTVSTSLGGGAFEPYNTIALNLDVPIFDRGVTMTTIAKDKEQVDRQDAVVAQTRIDIQVSVLQTLTNLVSSQAAVGQTIVELNEATHVIFSTRNRYREGIVTLPTLLAAETEFAQAQTDRVNAIYALRQAEQQYLYAVGEFP